MPDHINTTVLVIGLAIAFAVRFFALLAFLRIMIHLQNFDFAWLPLIGAAFLASVLDMAPLVGHFIAVPVLYLCVWKITRTSRPDAVFTVGISYALVRCLTFVVAAYLPFGFHPKSAEAANYDLNSLVPEPTNEMARATPPPAVPPAAPSATSPATPPATPPAAPPENSVPVNLSIVGVIRDGDDSMVTIKSGRKSYTISLGEGTSISTENEMVPVRFLEVATNTVTLLVDGQKENYAVR